MQARDGMKLLATTILFSLRAGDRLDILTSSTAAKLTSSDARP
jgi:hypothetical protein